MNAAPATPLISVMHNDRGGRSPRQKGNRAERAIAHLLTVRDELELAGRPPGEFVAITRQVQESILNDLVINPRNGGGRP
jgi:hypothetical protein